MHKILVMGLSGSGKTTFALKLRAYLSKYVSVDWFNADILRKKYVDWDFSEEGRKRQNLRMTTLANNSVKQYVICDFIAPLPELRDILNPDWIIWLDTIKECKYQDTNKMFVPPVKYDFRITTRNIDNIVLQIGDAILEGK